MQWIIRQVVCRDCRQISSDNVAVRNTGRKFWKEESGAKVEKLLTYYGSWEAIMTKCDADCKKSVKIAKAPKSSPPLLVTCYSLEIRGPNYKISYGLS